MSERSTAPTGREKPNPVHSFLEAGYEKVFRGIAWSGMPPWFIVTLEVSGRRTGETRSTVLVLCEHQSERYAVSAVSDESDWVKNVRAAHGRAVIHHGGRRRVALEEVPPTERAPILKSYLKWSLGARAVWELGPGSDMTKFEAIAAAHPVFRIAYAPG